MGGCVRLPGLFCPHWIIIRVRDLSEAVVILLQPQLRQLLRWAVWGRFGSQAHFVLLGIEVGVANHGVVDMYDAGVCAAEQLDPRLDEFVKEVHVLQSPTLDGDVKATRFGQVSFVDADDPETVVSP